MLAFSQRCRVSRLGRIDYISEQNSESEVLSRSGHVLVCQLKMADPSREDSSRDKFHLLFYGNFVHDPTEVK